MSAALCASDVIGTRPLRTLPLRLRPQPGEALDSWLEALAARADTAWGDMSAAVGIGRGDRAGSGIACRSWLVALAPGQREGLSLATGVETSLIQAMTLEQFRAKSCAHRGAGASTAPLRWLHSYVSRYCPNCLAETGGRWQLWWRLKWAFACPRHGCLLADACPTCFGVQRHRDLPADLVPAPGRCARTAPGAHGRNLHRCGTRLSDAPVLHLAVGHPALRAQRVMLDASVADTMSHGIYTHAPVSAEEFFNDVRAVGRRILRYASTDYLNRYLTADFVDLVCSSIASNRAVSQADFYRAVWASAPSGAAATTVALGVLGAADTSEAADRLHDLVDDCRGRGLSVSGSNIGWGRQVSTTLIGVQLRALAPFLGPSDQLRYRVWSPTPLKPHRSCERTARPLRNVPALLWRELSLRLAWPALAVGHTQLRSALSVAVSIVGTRLTLSDAAYRLGSATTGPATSRILQILRTSALWPEMSAVLIRLATYLDESPPPIDYTSRRALPYAGLLSDMEWFQICGRTGTPPGRGVKARVVRCWLYERLSGSPAMHCPGAHVTAEFRSKLADFPRHLTPELLNHLDEAAQRFLVSHGRRGEPITWCPPVPVDDLIAPAGVLGGVDPTNVRRLIREPSRV